MATLGNSTNGTSYITYGGSGTIPLTINSTAGVQFCNNSNTPAQLGTNCSISSSGVFNCSGLTISGPLTCSSLIIPNNGTITCLGSLNCSNTLNMNNNTITNVGGLTFSARTFQWIMTSAQANPGNGTTPVGSNIGAMNTQLGTGFSQVNIFGGASTTAWNTGTAIFTAPTSGLYHIQLNVFNNSELALTGRNIRFNAPTNSILGGTQYCYFNYTAIATGTSFNWTQMIWLDAGGSCYFVNEGSSNNLTFFYAPGHTTLNIVRIY